MKSELDDKATRVRHALELAAFLAAFYVVWSLRATVFVSIGESLASPTARAFYSILCKLAFWALPAWAFTAWLRRERPANALGLTVAPSRRAWLEGLGIAGAYLSAVAAFDVIGAGKHLDGTDVLSLPVALFALQYLASPFLEEVLFRGLVMRELAKLAPLPLASVGTSLLFLGAHLPYWLSHGGLSQELLVNSVGVFLFSNVACVLFARSSSIWPPTLAHIANNLLNAVLVGGHA